MVPLPSVPDKNFVKIDLSQGNLKVLKNSTENLEKCTQTKFQLDLVHYGLFAPGFWTVDSALLFYFELVSGVFTRDVLFIFYNQDAERYFSTLSQLLEQDMPLYSEIKSDLSKQQRIILNIMKALCEEYKQKFSELFSLSDTVGDKLLISSLCEISKKKRTLTCFKQDVENFLSTLQQVACSWTETNSTNTVEKLSTEKFSQSITRVIAETIDILERLEQTLMETEKRRQKYSGGVKQEYLSFLAPFVFQRFLVCLFTWNAFLIECFHSNFFVVETIRGFVTLTVGAPVVALTASLLFAYYYRRKSLAVFATEDIYIES